MNPAPGPASPPGPGDPQLKVTKAYLAHAQTVRRAAARAALGDYQAAEDATQEAFMEAFRNWPEFRRLPPGSSAHGYVPAPAGGS